MRYRLMGPSGMRVSELALGTMTFGEKEWGSERVEAERIFETYVAAGGNLIDTADFYAGGESERWVADLIKADRGRFVISTKYGLNRRSDDPNAAGAHRKNLVATVDGSLRRLGVDYIDLYWVHAWDPFTPMTEALRALDDLVRAGKVLYVGVSDTPAWVVARANAIAELSGWTSFVGYQGRYSLADRAVEREVLPMATALGLTFIAWGILGSGMLSGKYAAAQGSGGRLEVVGQAGREDQRTRDIVAAISSVATEIDATPSQVAVRWVIDQSGVIPLIGARTSAQLDDNLTALDIELNADQRERLEKATKIDLGFPHNFVEPGRQFLFGRSWERIDKPTQQRA